MRCELLINQETLKNAYDNCRSGKNPCSKCQYVDEKNCNLAMVSDALKLLKEKSQVAKWDHLSDASDKSFKGRCSQCGFIHYFIEGHDSQYNFCPQCGADMRGEINDMR